MSDGDLGWCGPECPGMHGREHQKSVCPLRNNPPLITFPSLPIHPVDPAVFDCRPGAWLHAPSDEKLSPHCQFGILFRLGSLWIGAHYSPTNRRWCINLVPFVTLWITLPWGTVP